MNVPSVVVVGSLAFVTALHAEDATLKMRFVFDGDPPAAKQINIRPAIAPAGAPVIDETLLVDPKSKGIQNVVVFVYTGRGGTTLDIPPHKGEKRRITMANARFDPHILLARAGDTLELIDQGPIGHSPNIAFFNNPPRGITLPPGQPNIMPLAQAEPAPIPIDCNIHPWMRAYLVILDHSFAAISDKNGTISIDGLPANTNLVFKVYHEAGRIDHVKINGVPTDWNRSRFELELSPGVNDLGDVLVSNDVLLN